MKRIFLSLLPFLVCAQVLLGSMSAQANIGSSPAVDSAGRVIYVRKNALDNGSELVAVNATEPSVVLINRPISANVFSSPVVDVDGYIYLATLDTAIPETALDAAKIIKFDAAFNKVWEFNVGSSVYSTVALTPPVVGSADPYAGQLFFGTKDGKVISLNTLDGSKNWEIETGFEIGGNATLWPLDKSLSIANASGEVFILDQTNGDIKASYTVHDRASVTTPVIAGNGDLVFTTFNGDVVRLARDGTQKWLTNLDVADGSKFIASPVIDRQGNIYVADYLNGVVFSLNENGQRNWPLAGQEVLQAGSQIYGTPMVINDGGVIKLVVPGISNGDDFKIVILDALTGAELDDFTSTSTLYAAVNLGGGNMLALNAQSQLLAFETTAISSQGQWGGYQLGVSNNGSHADTDGDLYVDAFDDFPADPAEWLDTDLDGLGNNLADNDDDGDGVVDSEDDFSVVFAVSKDTDKDGKPDFWNTNCDDTCRFYSRLELDLDDDNDGLSDLVEAELKTDPTMVDTDGDGLTDYFEVNTSFTACGSGVCITDYSSAIESDSDGDGISDKFEHENGLNPLVDDSTADYDGDGYDNLLESKLGRDPFENEFDDREFALIETFVSTATAGKLLASSDGKHLYAGAGQYVFDINPETGALENERETGLGVRGRAVISEDGRFVYVLKIGDSKTLETYSRDAETGGLSFLSEFKNTYVLAGLKLTGNSLMYSYFKANTSTIFNACVSSDYRDLYYYVGILELKDDGSVSTGFLSACIDKDDYRYSTATYHYANKNGLYLAGDKTLRLSASNKLTSADGFTGVVSNPLSSDFVYAISANRLYNYHKNDVAVSTLGLSVNAFEWEVSAYTKRLYGVSKMYGLHTVTAYIASTVDRVPVRDAGVTLPGLGSSMAMSGQYLYVQTEVGVVQLEGGYDGIGHVDTDGDGVIDRDDEYPNNHDEQYDTDGDGTPNGVDLDDDNDGTPDELDDLPLDDSDYIDTDGDNVGNTADPDDDGDGVLDGNDAFPLDGDEWLDTDGNGIGNNTDPDDDDDGVLDGDDIFPLDKDESMDTDGDGVGNVADPDDDEDGILDGDDAFPLNFAASTDTDMDESPNDWHVDCNIDCQTVSGLVLDLDDDGDGMSDIWEALNGYDSLLAGDAEFDLDGDGLTTKQEYDRDTDPGLPDTDGDGVSDLDDDFPRSPEASVDTDNDGLPDNWHEGCDAACKDASGLVLDLDDDNDEMSDLWEAEHGYDTLLANDSSLDGDGDGLTDLQESIAGTDPDLADTDGDGISDDKELASGLDPLADDSMLDSDGDGYSNKREAETGTDPFVNEFDDREFGVIETYNTLAVGGAVVVSNDGKHVYTGGGQYVFDRENKTGELTNERVTGIEFEGSHALMYGDNYLVAYASGALRSYQRNVETGLLAEVSSVAQGALKDLKVAGAKILMLTTGGYLQSSTISFASGSLSGKTNIDSDINAFEVVGGKIYTVNDKALSACTSSIYGFSCSYLFRFSAAIQAIMRNPLDSGSYIITVTGSLWSPVTTSIYGSDGKSKAVGLLGTTSSNNQVFGNSDNGYLYYQNAYALSAVNLAEDQATVSVVGSVSGSHLSVKLASDRHHIYATIENKVKLIEPGYQGIGHPDTDGDGVIDRDDAFPYEPSEQYDTDGDGLGDNADAFPNDPTEQYDFDGDGIGNNADPDDDNDGALDVDDAFPLDATESLDTDWDGIGNNADLDDDGDGMSDVYESNNGLNSLDALDRDLDLDNDGLSNFEESELGTFANNNDSDGDSIPDGWEVTYGLDPLLTADGLEDWDSDGHSNAAEYIVNTSPLDPRWYPGAPGLRKWGFDSGDKVRSSVAFGLDGQAYFVNDAGILFAVDSDGGEIWQFDTAAVVTTSPAIGLEGEIYYTDLNGDLTAVATNGDELWTFTIGVPIETTPVVGDNGVVFFGADDGVLYAIDADGSEKWTYETSDAIKSSPRLDKNGVVHFGSDDGQVYSVYSESGAEYRP